MLAQKQPLIQRVRNSSLVERLCAENLTEMCIRDSNNNNAIMKRADKAEAAMAEYVKHYPDVYKRQDWSSSMSPMMFRRVVAVRFSMAFMGCSTP